MKDQEDNFTIHAEQEPSKPEERRMTVVFSGDKLELEKWFSKWCFEADTKKSPTIISLIEKFKIETEN